MVGVTAAEMKVAKQAAFGALCDFVLGWYDLSEPLGGAPLDPDAPVPVVARILNDKLGALWHPADHPIGENRRYRGLFDCQNVLINPTEYVEDIAASYGKGGAVVACALAENQGVTNFGFALDDPDGTVYVSGDWLDDSGPWRPTDGFIEDAFAMWLLVNFFTVDGNHARWDGVTPLDPDEAPIELYVSGPGLGSERYGTWRALTETSQQVIYYDHFGWLRRSQASG